MLSVGPQELVIVGALVLFLLIFGSSRFSSAARDLGQLLGGARRTVEDVKSEFLPEEIDEARHAIEDFKTELGSGAERDRGRRKP
jgi:Sec-independent protein translocase protein TatA